MLIIHSNILNINYKYIAIFYILIIHSNIIIYTVSVTYNVTKTLKIYGSFITRYSLELAWYSWIKIFSVDRKGKNFLQFLFRKKKTLCTLLQIPRR